MDGLTGDAGVDWRKPRILIYSHDSFGLGHLRRCRAIAHRLAEASHDLSVLILSGSPIIGSFDFKARVDFVRVPGVIKLRNGEYTPLNMVIDIEQTLDIRSSIIMHTAEVFDPGLFIVDKEPLGLRGEVRPALELLRARGAPTVLGLRDVMDEPELLGPEWTRKGAADALAGLYDEIWIYGLPQICDPLKGIELPKSVHKKVVYTGYIPRTLPDGVAPDAMAAAPDGPYLLVTAGGGGDGEALFDWVLRAYEFDPGLRIPAILVLGPFMQGEFKQAFMTRTERFPFLRAIEFHPHMELLMDGAAGVVAMGGYNTFCEILSFDKPALIVPRTVPRMEQYIRASRAAELGLVAMLEDDPARPPRAMATALRQLTQQGRPSDIVIPGLLDGLDALTRLADRHLSDRAEWDGRYPRLALRG